MHVYRLFGDVWRRLPKSGSGHSVKRIASAALVAALAVEGVAPSIARAQSGEMVYVTEYDRSRIAVISTETNTVVKTIEPTSAGPLGEAVSPDGSVLYVAEQFGGVDILDTETNSITGHIGFGGATNVAVSPDGSDLYVLVTSNDSIAVRECSVEAETCPNNEIVALPGTYRQSPENLALSSDGKEGFVITANKTLVPFSTSTLKAGTPIGLPGVPNSVVVVGHTAYVALEERKGDAELATINTVSHRLGKTIDLAAGSSANGIAVSSDGETAYVAERAIGSMSEVDLGTRSVSATVDGLTDPAAISVMPDGSSAYAVQNGPTDRGVVPIDLGTGQPGNLIALGALPFAVAVGGG